MKKRVLAALLALALLLTTPALALPDSSQNFVRTKTYENNFSDLTRDSVFYDNVAALYEYGLSLGKDDGTYGLKDSLTLGQIVIFAGRIRSLYRTGDPESGPAVWRNAAAEREEPYRTYLPYLLYLQNESVLSTELDSVLHLTATRAQVAHVLANLLPAEVLPTVHDSLIADAYASRQYIKDVTEYTDYYQDILLLYRTGVSVGSDASGSFLPDQPITRGAVGAILTRMIDPALRVTPKWTIPPAWSAAGTTLASLIPAGDYVAAPRNEAELDSTLRFMLASGQDTLSLQFPSSVTVSAVFAQDLMERALNIVKSYCEQCYNSVSCSYSATGSITLTFSAAGAAESIQTYRAETMAAAIAVHDKLWESGQITSSMTETQKAYVYYTWICQNCTYDIAADDNSLSHIAYSLFRRGTAVCDGYTGAYNLLLKLEGIACTTVSTASHIWTAASLDGSTVHIDTTWADSNPALIDTTYFAMTPAQSWQLHRNVA